MSRSCPGNALPIAAWLLALLLAGAAPAAQALPGFRALPPASVEQQTYQHARALALSLVEDAAPELGARDARLAARVLPALRRSRFLASSDARSTATCAARRFSLFVNARHRDRIFICDEVRPHARQPDRDAIGRIAQGFVHEAVHLAGEMDECVATRFERAVMQRTIGVQSQGSRISYGDECRLRR